MTVRRRLLFGFSLMVLPVVLVGVAAIRSNALEHQALEALGAGLARNRTYAEVENAMTHRTVVVWRYLTGLDPQAKTEFRLTGDVVEYWIGRWRAELRPDERSLADGIQDIERRIDQVGDSVFRLFDAGHRREAYVVAQLELNERLLPALERINRDVYRRARENSIQRAFGRVEAIVDSERRALLWIVLLAVAASLLTSWLVARGLVRPLSELQRAMAAVGSGDLSHPIRADRRDEIGDLARTFARMTDDLRRTQAKLVESEKLASIGTMAAAVAHGLRNPLASLRAAAQVVRAHPTLPSAREHLDAIVGEVDRLDRRIAHLLTFAGPARWKPARERLPALIRGLLPAFTERLREHGVAAVVDLAPDLPEVWIDPRMAEQTFVELLANAVDAMPNGGTLRIAAQATPSGDGASGVEVVISDTGGGIPDEVLPSIYEPFFTTRPQGTGLGLAIAKRFVDYNGGRLTITSRLEAGTAARVWLPAADAASAE